MTREKLVYRITSHIPSGSVLSYGDVARIAGIHNPRHVGAILHDNPDPKTIPCHRVVDANGRLAKAFRFGGAEGQRSRLEEDSVSWDGPRVDLLKSHWVPSRLFQLYIDLLKKYGEPGPWPWFGADTPHTEDEIAIGAILTQNTNWKNVQKVIDNLRRNALCNLDGIATEDISKLKELIRPSGYYNQKAERLQSFARFVCEHGGLLSLMKNEIDGLRTLLLSQKGIGNETADTILLYAGRHPVFVIDAYTKRFCKAMRLSQKENYDELQDYFTVRLPRDARVFQDFHALIVEWAKR